MAFQHSQVKGLPRLSTGPCCYLERRRLNTAECFRFLRSLTYLPEDSSKGKGLKSKPKKRRSGALAINVFNGLLPSNRSLRCRGQNYAILSLSLFLSLSHFTSLLRGKVLGSRTQLGGGRSFGVFSGWGCSPRLFQLVACTRRNIPQTLNFSLIRPRLRPPRVRSLVPRRVHCPCWFSGWQHAPYSTTKCSTGVAKFQACEKGCRCPQSRAGSNW